MNAQEKVVALKLMAAVAWADGVLTASELDSLVDFLSELGSWHGSELKEALRTGQGLQEQDLEAVENMSLEGFARLLRASHTMVNAERPATAAEQAVLRQLVDRRLGDSAWSVTQRWLDSDRAAGLAEDANNLTQALG